MSDRKTLQIKQISGHSGAAAGFDMQRDCGGLQADRYHHLHRLQGLRGGLRRVERHAVRPTTFDNTYQTMPETRWNFWNLIKFNEHQREDGTIQWLMRKDQCMHCADPGCLRACPADGAIVQYTNGIVDFQQENCIGCEFCVSGCPFDIPKFNPFDEEGLQVHAVLRPRGRRSGARVHQGVSYGLSEVRHERRYEVHRRKSAPSNCARILDSRMPACTIRNRLAART